MTYVVFRYTQWRRFLLNSGGGHGELGARAYTGGSGGRCCHETDRT